MRPLFKLLLFAGLIAPVVYTGQKWAYADTVEYAVPTCQRHNLYHDDKPIVGVEDMAYDTTTQRIYMSAYDRRNTLPGGVYSVNPNDLNDVKKLTLPRVTYPHGIDLSYDEDVTTLTVIDRNFDTPQRVSARLRRYKWSKNVSELIEITSAENDGFCNANDLATLNDNVSTRYLITRDHQSCGKLSKSWENISQPKSADLVSFDFDTAPNIYIEKSGLYFANGITALKQNETAKLAVYVAETRKKRLSVFKENQAEKFELSQQISLPGGPDNLTRAVDQDTESIWAALHPNLIKFAAYRAGWLRSAPSRFAHIKPNETVIYNVAPDIISGATVALEVDGTIFLGAAYDNAIATCNIKGLSSDK